MVLNIHDQKRLRDRRGRAFFFASVIEGISAVRSALLLGLAVFTTACTTYGVVANQPLSTGETSPGYGFGELAKKLKRQTGDLTLAVAFSGGGTRAAALAYGVMQELRATSVDLSGDPHSLLDAISIISSVSGGSFTSAYYGLYGDRLFVDFEQRFLRRNVEGALLRSLLDPPGWFSSRGRTEIAVAYYRQAIFGDATFADLMREDAPLILINSSDLGSGACFTFAQEYFNLLCSDLTAFSLARAVTASSARFLSCSTRSWSKTTAAATRASHRGWRLPRSATRTIRTSR